MVLPYKMGALQEGDRVIQQYATRSQPPRWSPRWSSKEVVDILPTPEALVVERGVTMRGDESNRFGTDGRKLIESY